jgi:lipoprotein-releasing system permease protein
LNFSAFIANRITFHSRRTFSKISVRIAVAGIMLSLGVMILSLAVVRGFKNGVKEKVRGFSGDILVMKYDLNGSYETSPFEMRPGTLNKLRSFPEIEFVQPYAMKPGIIKTDEEVEGVVFKGVDRTYNWNYYHKILVAGKVPDFSDSVAVRSQIMISQYMADRLGLKAGDDFLIYFVQENLRPRKFTIRGIFSLGIEEVDKSYVVGDLSIIRRLNDWKPGETGGYEIRVKDFSKLDTTATKVYENLDINLKSYAISDYYSTIFQWLSMLDVNTQVILILMICVAVINMVSALLIIIMERTNMIGILKALGCTNWEIQEIFLTNAAYIIGLGMLLGNLLGCGLGYFQLKTHFFGLDQASYYVSYVPVEFNLVELVLVNAATLVICLVVLLLPSLVVSRISPVKAIAFK